MEKKIKGWRLFVMTLEVTIITLIALATLAIAVGGSYLIYLQTSWQVEHEGWSWWYLVYGILASFIIRWMAGICMMTVRLIANYVFLIRNPHNDPMWLYEGVGGK